MNILNTTFNEMSNTTFNTICLNKLSLFNMNKEIKNIHESLQRLYLIAGVDTPMDLANLLNESPQTINNWGIRGVSKQGAINASQKIQNCDVNFILHGIESDSATYQQTVKPVLVGAKSSLSDYESNGLDIPLLAATGSMGNGNDSEDGDLVIDVLRVTKQWVHKTLPNVSKVSNLRFIHAMGDSMLPTFNDGDILLVDAGACSVSIDGVYVLDAHNRLFIKRVRRKMDGAYEISSDNPSVKTVDTLNGDHEVSIKGRVVWVWNGKRV